MEQKRMDVDVKSFQGKNDPDQISIFSGNFSGSRCNAKLTMKIVVPIGISIPSLKMENYLKNSHIIVQLANGLYDKDKANGLYDDKDFRIC